MFYHMMCYVTPYIIITLLSHYVITYLGKKRKEKKIEINDLGILAKS